MKISIYRVAVSACQGMLLTFVSTVSVAANNVTGAWASPTVNNWPLIPIHAALTPDGRVLSYGTTGTGTQTGYFIYDVWDPEQNLSNGHPTEQSLANGHITLQNLTQTDLFCSSQVILPQSGGILITGGDNWTGTATTNTGNNNSNIFDSAGGGTLTRSTNMNRARWYSSATVMMNGEVYIQGGNGGADRPEVRQLDGSFRLLSGANTSTLAALFPRNFVAPDGRIFGYDTSGRMYYVNPSGTGTIALGNQIPSSYVGWTSSAAMFRPGKILQFGGNSNGAVVIDITGAQPVVTPTQSMSSQRQWVSATVLPDGRVLATGGTAVENQQTGVNNSAEIWNPATGQWTVGSSGLRARMYHSGALLLPDASVLVEGGGAPGPLNNLHAEIYYPPYLYDASGNFAARPAIVTAPDTIFSGQDFSIGVGAANISRVTMVKTGSVTHSVNMDQRFVELAFTASSGTLFVQKPSNPNDLTPGYYLLFVIDNQGVPSHAKIVRMSLDPQDLTPPTQPTGLTATAINSGSIGLSWNASTDNVGVTGYRIFRGGTQTATTAGTSYTDSGLNAGTTYSYTVAAYDAAGNQSAQSVAASATTLTSGPSQYVSQDIGTVGSAGSTSESGGVYTVRSSGADIWGTADGFQFAWWLFSGDGTITARLVSQVRTHGWAKAGLMLRENLAPGSRNATVVVHPSNGIEFQYRTATNGITRGAGDGDLTKKAPYWLRLVRQGNTITGYISPNGVQWTLLGQISLTGLPSTVYIGLGVTSHDLTKFSTAVFDNVSLVSGAQANVPPALTNPGNQTGTVGLPVNLAIQASDPNGDTLTYSATGLPAGLSIASSTGVISGTPTAAGTSAVTVSVTDGVAPATANFSWTILNADPLVLDPMPLQPARLANSPVTYTAVSHGGINPQYRWFFDDGSESGWLSSASVTHTFTGPSIYWVSVTVRDDRGLEASQTFSQLIHLPLTSGAPAISSSIRNSGGRLWVVNEDNDSVTVFDSAGVAKLAEIDVGSAPRTLAVASNGEIWVTNLRSSSISVISPSSLTVVRTISLPVASRPYGIVFAQDGSAAYVALEALGRVLKLDPVSGAQLGSVEIGSNPHHLSLTADGTRLLVSRFITPPLPGESTATVVPDAGGIQHGGEVVVVDTATMSFVKTIVLRHSDDPDFENQGSGIPNYLGAAAISPDGTSAWVPSKKDNVKRGTLRSGVNLNHQNTVRAISSRIDLGTLTETFGARVDHDNASLASAAAYDRYGVFLFVALETSREVAVIDAQNHAEFFRINVGRAPHGLAVSDDGYTLYVHNFMDRTVGLYDLHPLIDSGQWNAPLLATLQNVSLEKLNPDVLKGKQFFYDARDTRLAREGYMSCASCHNDGGHDGRVWDITGLGEGLRNTISLAGKAGTAQGRLHWTANFDEVQDFEGQIRTLAGGTGLMADADFNAGTRSQPLGDPKAGVSADLDALASYLASLDAFAASPYRNSDGSLTVEGVAGRAVFQAQGCAVCHGGTAYSDSSTGALHDVGTIRQPTTGNRLGSPVTGLDTQTLRGIWATAPYLHDGSAATLQDAVQAHQGVSMSSSELNALVAYLQQIDGTEPTPGAGDTAPPSQPGGLTATAINSSSIGLSWDPATDDVGVAGYRVFRGGAQIATTIGTSYTNSGLSDGTTYSYTVAAYDAAGNQSAQSIAASATTPDTTAPTQPTGLTATAIDSGSIGLSWSASTDNVGVTGYRVFRDGAQIATMAGTSYTNSGLSAGTTYSYTVAAYDAAGNQSAQSVAAGTTTLGGGLPPYVSQDIGTVGPAGSTSESGGVYTVRSSGADIWGTADGFQFAWWLFSGDGTITAHLVSQVKTHSWAKAGVMLRESLAAGSRNATVVVHPTKGIEFQYRTATNGITKGIGDGDLTKKAPYWVRLVRQGDLVIGYISPDGVQWTELSRITLTGLPTTVYVGLPVSSHDITKVSTAVFDNVSIVSGPPGP